LSCFLDTYTLSNSTNTGNNNNYISSSNNNTTKESKKRSPRSKVKGQPWIKKNKKSVTTATQTTDSEEDGNGRANLTVEEVGDANRQTDRQTDRLAD
jgi:hypothetical protein